MNLTRRQDRHHMHSFLSHVVECKIISGNFLLYIYAAGCSSSLSVDLLYAILLLHNVAGVVCLRVALLSTHDVLAALMQYRQVAIHSFIRLHVYQKWNECIILRLPTMILAILYCLALTHLERFKLSSFLLPLAFLFLNSIFLTNDVLMHFTDCNLQFSWEKLDMIPQVFF